MTSYLPGSSIFIHVNIMHNLLMALLSTVYPVPHVLPRQVWAAWQACEEGWLHSEEVLNLCSIPASARRVGVQSHRWIRPGVGPIVRQPQQSRYYLGICARYWQGEDLVGKQPRVFLLHTVCP